MGINTLKRIIEISNEVSLHFDNIWILINRFPEDLRCILEKAVDKIKQDNVKFLGSFPNDSEISKINLTGENLLNLSVDNTSYQQAKQIFSRII